MDHARFDGLTRALSLTSSRRGFAQLLTSLTAGLLLGSGPGLMDATAHDKRDKCKKLNDKDKRKKCLAKAKKHSRTHRPPLHELSCARTCNGCCDASGRCQMGTSSDSCGAGGASCQACTGLRGTCLNGACTCDVCATGCPYTTLQAAIDDRNRRSSTINICPGIYSGTIQFGDNFVENIVGAGDGDDPATSTILDAGRQGSVIMTFMWVDATIENLRITGGLSTHGGGVFISNNNSIILKNCTIIDNEAEDGGGIYSASNLTIKNSRIIDNTATGDGSVGGRGGGIFSDLDSLGSQQTQTFILDGTVITDNRALGTNAQGGGIYSNKSQFSDVSANITLQDSGVSGNEPDNCAGEGTYTDPQGACVPPSD